MTSDLTPDVRHAVRALARSPGFAAVAILTLALGIGANTAMFAVVNGVLLKPLPYADAGRLMLVHLLAPDRVSGITRQGVWSYPKYRSFLEAQDVFDHTALFTGRDVNLTGAASPMRLRAEITTERYPALLGVHPVLGRPFTGREAHIEGEPRVAMISHALWTRGFGADANIIGRAIALDAVDYQVVGVLPRGFNGLSGNAEIWVPAAAFDGRYLTQRYAHGYYLVAHRKAAIDEAQAIAAVQGIGGRLAQEYSDFGGASWGATATSLSSSRIDRDLRLAALLLLGAVAFVLLIACINLTNLLIARALNRRREVAVRLALGATRAQVVRQFIVESAIVTALGAAAGLIVAGAALSAAGAALPTADSFFRIAAGPGTPSRLSGAQGLTLVGASMIAIDWTTLAFACVVAAVIAGAISIVPALRSSALRPIDTLKSRGSATAEHGSRLDTRGALVMFQIMLALVLLAGAGLMIRSAARLHATAIGVDPHNVVTARVDLPPAHYDEARRAQWFTTLHERLSRMSSVESMGIGNCPPVSGGCNSTVIGFVPGKHRVTPEAPIAGVHFVSPTYFSTLGIRLVRGRLFTDQDRIGRAKVVVVNESAARRFWPGADPLGKPVTLGQGGFHDGAVVIGVVADVRYTAIEAAPGADAYISLLQAPQARVRLFIRSRGNPDETFRTVRQEVAAIDPDLPLSETQTMEQRIGDAMWRTRVAAWLLSALSAVAVLLTAVGIFGVMAQVVAQKTPDIGVRMALGAEPREVLRLVLGQAAVLIGTGLVLGIGAGLIVTRAAESLLYEVTPADSTTFGAVSVLLAVVALAASYIPARRAARVDPIVALRYE